MLLLRVADGEGCSGWGEVWCNFPECGAEHRARLVETVFLPMLIGRNVESVPAVFADLTRATEILAIQAGERGPIAQCIAGLDMALWDLAARRAGEPLWHLLGGSDASLSVYASGINPGGAAALAQAKCAEGYRAFKLKVGFGEERDMANLGELRALLGAGAALMVDANQAWDLDEALAMAERMAPFALRWLEEPLRADAAPGVWAELAHRSAIPLAAGENIAGTQDFAAAIGLKALSVLQPDMAKWGGFSGCLPVARRALAAGLAYCPHYLGGGIGLLASAHLLAAAGGGGMLEIDANPNPLRTLLMGALARVADGRCRLSDDPGLGIAPDIAALRPFSAA